MVHFHKQEEKCFSQTKISIVVTVNFLIKICHSGENLFMSWVTFGWWEIDETSILLHACITTEVGDILTKRCMQVTLRHRSEIRPLFYSIVFLKCPALCVELFNWLQCFTCYLAIIRIAVCLRSHIERGGCEMWVVTSLCEGSEWKKKVVVMEIGGLGVTWLLLSSHSKFWLLHRLYVKHKHTQVKPKFQRGGSSVSGVV